MESVKCNLCGRDNSEPHLTKGTSTIVRCAACQLVYVNPRSFAMEHDDYFRGPYLSTIEENGRLRPGIEYLYGEITRNLSTYLQPGRLLDVGCAMGHFMVYARERGWDVRGVECSTYAARYGREKYGLQIDPVCDLREARLPGSHYDACVLVEVAEHLPNPRATFAEAFRVLKPGGAIYVTTPNFDSAKAMLLREEWSAVIPSGHLYYFTGETLGQMLQSVGFVEPANITDPADVQAEVKALRESGDLKLGDEDVQELLSRVSAEDTGKISNGRSEGLIVWAAKPYAPLSPMTASLRYKGRVHHLENKIVRVAGQAVDDQKIYYVQQRRKHWIISAEWLRQRGLQLEDATIITREELASLLDGQAVQ